MKRGQEYQHQAIAEDPTYARAYAWLAENYLIQVYYGQLYPADGFPKAKEAATRALEIDPGSGEARTVLAAMSCFSERDRAVAEREYKHAIELNPSYTATYMSYAACISTAGRTQEAIKLLEKAQELDPLSPLVGAAAGYYLCTGLRKYDQAAAFVQEALELDPDYWMAHHDLGCVYEGRGLLREAIAEYEKALDAGGSVIPLAALGHAYAVMGRKDEARKILTELKDRPEPRHISDFYIALVHIGLGEKDQAMERLEKAYAANDFIMYWGDSRFDPLREDPRFQDLLRRVNLTE